MRRHFDKVSHRGQPQIWLGANFWSRTGGPLMWRNYDGNVVSEELQVLAEHGLNMTRSFAYWPDFHPAPDRIDDEMLDRFADFLDRHLALGMQSVPTFIIGHMSGENWDPAWRGERDLYADVWLVARQAWFAGQFVRRLTDHPAVAGWLLSNEMPIYGRPRHLGLEPAHREVVTPWAQLLIEAVRAAGGTQPVSTGDGTWGVEMTGQDNGFSVREIAPLVDFLGPHVYRMETDLVRQHLSAAFICELAGFAGKPVVLEEFGVTTDFASAENAGHYYRQVLHNSLLAGATGWIAWNNTDYDSLWAQPPYSHHPFEMHFGITDAGGAPKEPLRELAKFRAVLDHIDVVNCSRPDASVAVIVPSYLEMRYPFTEPEDQTTPVASLRQAYVAAREADLPVVLARELDGLPADAALLIAPSIKQLTSGTWRRLAQLASGGATVYASYFTGGHDVQRGPWYADLNGLFGVEHQLVYGLANPVADERVTITFVQEFGGIPVGARLTFRVGGSVAARSYLPVNAAEATVVAVDEEGRPALLVNEVGMGRAVLATYAFEHFGAQLAAVNPEPTYRIYSALAVIAGVQRDVLVDDPLVHVGELSHSDGRRFIWLVSQSAEELLVKPQLRDGLRLRAIDRADPLGDICLGRFGVEVLCLEADVT